MKHSPLYLTGKFNHWHTCIASKLNNSYLTCINAEELSYFIPTVNHFVHGACSAYIIHCLSSRAIQIAVYEMHQMPNTEIFTNKTSCL